MTVSSCFWCRYNFHLFPRDELKMGMPSYSFSCQTSYLTSMARDGFDFNACIYDGEPCSYMNSKDFKIFLSQTIILSNNM